MAAATFGKYSFDSRLVADEFQDLINEAALHRLRRAEVGDEMRADHRFSSWVGLERQQILATLLVSVATVQAGTYFIERAPTTRTSIFAAPGRLSDHQWLDREMSLSNELPQEFGALCAEVRSAAESALARLLPSSLSEEQARAWAEELVRSTQD